MTAIRVRYEPDAEDLSPLGQLAVAHVLVAGEPSGSITAQLDTLSLDARWAQIPPLLPQGVYLLEDASRAWSALVLERGPQPVASRTDRMSQMNEQDPLAAAAQLFEAFWDKAQGIGPAAAFADGSIVRTIDRSRFGRISGRRKVRNTFLYRVVIDGVESEIFADNLEQAAGDPRSPSFWIQGEPAGAEAIGLTVTWIKLRHPLTDVIYSFQASKTVFRAYQFRPVLTMLSHSHHRLLIADEVGLGKTIEAGLIWTELSQRTSLRRLLVVAPAALTIKWKREMERRFDLFLKILRREDLDDLIEALERGDTESPFMGVISLQSLRSAPQLERLRELWPRFDLIIVDEAHDLRNRSTRSHHLGITLSDWADAMVFLSATPINLRSSDLFNLLRLLNEDDFQDESVFAFQLEPNEILNEVARRVTAERDQPRTLMNRLLELDELTMGTTVTSRPDFRHLCTILDREDPLTSEDIARVQRHLAELNTLSGILTRTRKRDVPEDRAVREPRTIDVDWTQAERDFYDGVWNWYRARALRAGHNPGFTTQMPLRQAASCIPALQSLLRERAGAAIEEDLDDDESPPNVTDYAELAQFGVRLDPLRTDTKFENLVDELRRVRASGLHQIMIFSFFRRTLAYLKGRLEDEFRVRVMHGGVPMIDRDTIIADFESGAYDILLLSEVGSEGLDFQFCNVLVNYDLPWNPMRVEQRIGRLDRFGQPLLVRMV